MSGDFQAEIVGGGKIGWTDGTHLEVQRLSRVALLVLRGEPETKKSVNQQKLGQALLYAAGNQDVGAVGTLVEAGADVNYIDRNRPQEGLTPLIQAARYGCVNVVWFLLNSGAKPDIRSKNLGFSALFYALDQGQGDRIGVVEALLEGGTDPNEHAPKYDGWTPLHYSVAHLKNLALAKVLLDHGANLEARCSAGRTVLGTAIHIKPNIEIVSYLIERGARTDAVCGKQGARDLCQGGAQVKRGACSERSVEWRTVQ